MDIRGTLTRAALALALSGLTLAGIAHADSSPTATLSTTGPAAYQGKLTRILVLGPQWSPTVVVKTPPLPAGTYLVNATAGAVIASNDQIVCAVGPSTAPRTNDGIFGTAGNASSGGFIYGTAPIADSWQITTGGTSLDLVCNSFNYGKGTYVGSASITALPVGSLVVTSH
jgi:hypothetical protein